MSESDLNNNNNNINQNRKLNIIRSGRTSIK